MTVLTDRQGYALVVTLNRPEKRNALDPETIDGIAAALDTAESDSGIRVVVLTGAGDRAFCAGMDLTQVANGDTSSQPPPGSRRYMRFMEDGFSKPVVAAVNGTALAGGLELMLACDLAVVADHAELGIPEVARGLIAGAGGTLLPLRIPRAFALELGLTGRPVSAQRAYEMGLVNAVVPGDQVLPKALELAEAIAANSPAAVGVTRRLMALAPGQSRAEAWEGIRAAMREALSGPDAQEGAQAFFEKRTPRWT